MPHVINGEGFKSLAEPWCDTTTPAGELILTVFAGVATFERKRITERQREGIEAAKRKGIYRGGKKRFDDGGGGRRSQLCTHGDRYRAVRLCDCGHGDRIHARTRGIVHGT